MAIQLPLELLHEIILLNDDQFTKEGPVATYIKASAPHSEYVTEKSKPCASSIARVCKCWRAFVENSPRLRLSCLNLLSATDVEGSLLEAQRKAALNEAFADGIHSSNADLDINIHHSFSDDQEILFAIDRLLCQTVERWRWLWIDGCIRQSSERWSALMASLSSTPHLRGLRYTGDVSWLASLHQWHAPNLETIEVLNHHSTLGSFVLPEIAQAFKSAFKRSRYSNLTGDIPDSDVADQRILSLYRVFPSTGNFDMRVSEHCNISTTHFEVQLLSDCEPGIANLSPPRRQLSLSGSESFVIRMLTEFPVKDIPSLSIFATGSTPDLHMPLETPNLSSLQLSLDSARLSSMLSYMDCKNLTFLDLEIRHLVVATVSLNPVFPALLRFRLATGKGPFQDTRMMSDVGNFKAPGLQELLLQGVLKAPVLQYKVKPVLPNLQKVTFGGGGGFARFGELAFLSTFNAPLLEVLDVTNCRMRNILISDVDATTILIKDALITVEIIHIGNFGALVVLESFVRFTPKLVALQVCIEESLVLELLDFLGIYGEGSTNPPLLSKLEIQTYSTGHGECRAAEVIERLVDAIVARREAGAVEFEHISLKVFEELQYQEACCSQLGEVFTNQTTFELRCYDGTSILI